MLSVKENVIVSPLIVPVIVVFIGVGCPVDVVGKFPITVLPDWLRNTVNEVPTVPPIGISVTLQSPVVMDTDEVSSVPVHGAAAPLPIVYVPDMLVPSEDTVPVYVSVLPLLSVKENEIFRPIIVPVICRAEGVCPERVVPIWVNIQLPT